jgi:3-dehydroquinate synthase
MLKESFTRIDSLHYPVFIGSRIWDEFDSLIRSRYASSNIFILSDRQVYKKCMSVLLERASLLRKCPSKIIPAGEFSKDIENVKKGWEWLASHNAGRNDLLINFGGGVISDLGGFAASSFKRGMPFLNIPTSLIGQADAAIGGKNGINLNRIKNQVGTFKNPAAVFADPVFLQFLQKRELVAGYAEIIKSALIAGGDFWRDIKLNGFEKPGMIEDLITRSVQNKISIVDGDPFDIDKRKSLNFGHTLGHAFESLSMEAGQKPMLHGEAVAAGIICEAYISCKLIGLSRDTLHEILHLLNRYFPSLKIDFHEDKFSEYLLQDKKSQNGVIRMSLLNAPGIVLVDQPASMEMITESIEYYKEMTSP